VGGSRLHSKRTSLSNSCLTCNRRSESLYYCPDVFAILIHLCGWWGYRGILLLCNLTPAAAIWGRPLARSAHEEWLSGAVSLYPGNLLRSLMCFTSLGGDTQNLLLENRVMVKSPHRSSHAVACEMVTIHDLSDWSMQGSLYAACLDSAQGWRMGYNWCALDTGLVMFGLRQG